MKNRDRTLYQLLLAAFVVRLSYALLIPDFALSLDMQRWIKVAELLRQGINPYVATSYLNTAPFSMQALFVLDHIANLLSLSLPFCLQLLFTAADLAVVALLFQALQAMGSSFVSKVILGGYALNPISILLTVQHGQFDVLVGMLLLLFVLELQRYGANKDDFAWLLACFYLGLAIWVKTAPIILLPLALSPPALSKHTRFFGAILALTPVALSMSVIFVLAPQDVADKVIGYASVPGLYGITGLLGLFGWEACFKPYTQLFFLAIVASMIALSKLCSEAPPRSLGEVSLISSALLLALPTLGPGYGHQYISWCLPLLVVTFAHATHRLQVSMFVSLVLVALTYIFEYGMMIIGNGLQYEFITSHVRFLAGWNLAEILTVLRLPMFLSMLLLLVLLTRDILQMRASAQR
ncbi:MAG: hypothetical protein K1X79_04005 [Oligoflexia bacterium]|nr:hypothetical protein [Oligoflexia bacterium]